MKIIFSPHCDDAFLSLGGLILKSKDEVKIIDVFNRSKFGKFRFGKFNANSKREKGVTKIRKKEEEKNWELAEVEGEFWDYPEGILRGYKRWDSSFDLRKDKKLYDEIKQKIKSVLDEYSNAEFYFPLAYGLHTDHVFLRRIGEYFLNERKYKICFYEDITYLAKHKSIDNFIKKHNLTVSEIDISRFLNKKLLFVKNYKSQQVNNYMTKIVKNFYKNPDRKIERVWRKR